MRRRVYSMLLAAAILLGSFGMASQAQTAGFAGELDAGAPAEYPEEATPTPTLDTVSITDAPEATPSQAPSPTPSPTPASTPEILPAATPEATPTPTPIPQPEQTPEATPVAPAPLQFVTMAVQDTVVNIHDQAFSLTNCVTAVDENNNPVGVTVLNDGGFLIDQLGVYTVLFEARHPITQEAVAASCLVTVIQTGIMQEEVQNQSTLKGTSDARYQKYAQYRDEISSELNAHMLRLNGQFSERMELLRSAFTDAEGYRVMRQYYAEQTETDETLDATFQMTADFEELAQPALRNWSQVLAVYVAKNVELTLENPLDLFNLRKISFEGIDEVFWDMHDIRFETVDGVAQMILTERTSSEMAAYYGFSEQRRAQLDELMQPEFLRLFAALTGDTSFFDMSEEQAAAIRANLPNGLTMQRENVVMAAHSLVGQVQYFWGGKYPSLNWNPLWGVPKVVTSPNSPTTGTVRPFGLDCSGFVAWAFVNAAGDASVVNAIGNGSTTQWNNSRSVGWDEAQPGDLAFKAIPGTTPTNHVGIVVECKADGSILVAHCSSSNNNVIVSEAWSSSFRYIRRPALYGGY